MVTSVVAALSTANSLIIYTLSESMVLQIRQALRQAMRMHRDYIVDAQTAKELTKAKNESNAAPLLCDRWLIHANVDKFSKRDIDNALKQMPGYGVVVYWTTRYGIYKYLSEHQAVKKFSNLYPVFRFSSFSDAEVYQWHEYMLIPQFRLSDDLVQYLSKHYRYDIESIFKLFKMINSGYEVKTTTDIIEAIGLGSNSIPDLVVSILSTTTATDKGKKRFLAKFIKAISEMTISYNYQQIRSFMLNTLNAFIDMKTLQLLGLSHQQIYEIPENFDKIRLERHRRYAERVYRDFTYPQLLKLKVSLLAFDGFDFRENLIMGVIHFLDVRKPPENKFMRGKRGGRR